MTSFQFIGSYSVIRGNRYKLIQKHVHYNLTKFSFSNRVVPIWNSLPDLFVCLLFNGTSALFRPLVPRIVETEHTNHVKNDLK